MALPAKKPAAAPAKPAAKAPAAKAEVAKEKVKKPGIGDFVKAQILAGKDNEKIAEMVQVKFPDAKTTNASINWYRSALRKDGQEVPSSRKPKAEKPAKAAAAPKAPAKAAAKPAAKAPAKKAAAEDDGDFES